ncbi:hypothetical protein GJU43_16530 [Flavobacterium sp. LC2016-23]|uniref:hypothetical protein n=1 Tax=Flavobacterium sp. LC2016-23 TaxID=2666330 RepID=UPI0012AF33B2|nr:hypothetical protein [Flavobacterium sp. LC2016-23]MRX40897.1 hypothetical protein [Flavobacterium sp. LC2016-23]
MIALKSSKQSVVSQDKNLENGAEKSKIINNYYILSYYPQTKAKLLLLQRYKKKFSTLQRFRSINIFL